MRTATATLLRGRTQALILLGAFVVLLGGVANAQAAPALSVSASHAPSEVSRGDEYMTYAITVANSGDQATSAPTTITLSLPDGMLLDNVVSGSGWSCSSAAAVCSNSGSVAAGESFPVLTVGMLIAPAQLPDAVSTTFTASGGGAAGAAMDEDAFVLGPWLTFGLVDGSFVAGACFSGPPVAPPTTGACQAGGAGDAYTQAGGHPFSASAAFRLKSKQIKPTQDGETTGPFEETRDAVVSLPPGFVANPQAVVGGCTIQQVQNGVCPSRYAVGRAWVGLHNLTMAIPVDQLSAIYKLTPQHGYPAAFGLRVIALSPVTVVLRPKVRPGDFTVSVASPYPPQDPSLFEVRHATFCSYGARVEDGGDGPSATRCNNPADPGALAVPFLTNPTRCTGQPDVTSIALASYQNPGATDVDGFPDLTDSNWKTGAAESPALTGCEQVPFEPSVSVAPTSSTPDSASGLSFDLDVPQDGLIALDGIATAHLKKTVVELPAGVSVNPSAATGLQGCSDSQMGLVTRNAPGPFPTQFNGQPVACPDESKLGTVWVTSPLVDEVLEGQLYLGTPKSTDPASGQMLRVFLVVRNDKIGVMVKLEGSTIADPATGRLTATFDNNPQLPFDRLEVRLKDGPKGVLATPQRCGDVSSHTALSPWTGEDVDQATPQTIAGDCSFGFAPTLDAGMDTSNARANGTFKFKFTRPQGDQTLSGLTAKLPSGLLASVKDLPLCKDAQAAAGACPAESKIGIVDAKAGSGDPFVLEEKGEVFLTEGYKGGEYGLAVKVRPIAGPFRGDMELSPIIVRQAIHVDRKTAQVTAVSDPFPQIHHGVPLRVREVTVLVNRDRFMLNPSNCAPKQVGAAILSAEGAVADTSNLFQATGCAALPFKPRLALRLTGRRQVTTGTHPGIRAQVNQQGIGEAGIEKAVVRLPKSLALDVNNAQALCEFVDGTKPDLENHCPKGSIVGRARAKTPLLDDDLAGNVYFVKNVRKDPVTGNEIRTLPMIVVALRGEIAINLRGESDTTKAGKLVNTFDQVPDAPVSQFNLHVFGGKDGVLAVTRTRRSLINLCAKPSGHLAEADMDGHNGRRHDRNIRMSTPCSKRQTKAAKRQAKRAAKRAARG